MRIICPLRLTTLLDSITLALKLKFFTQTVRISTNLGKARFMQRKKKVQPTIMDVFVALILCNSFICQDFEIL